MWVRKKTSDAAVFCIFCVGAVAVALWIIFMFTWVAVQIVGMF